MVMADEIPAEVLEEVGLEADVLAAILEDPQVFIEQEMLKQHRGEGWDQDAVEIATQIVGVATLVSRGIDYDLAVEIIDRDAEIKLALADGKLDVTFSFDEAIPPVG